mmetsp:Transcript_23113/g.38022  ORF Transcript_23113/g.38022 Transcript_23113/m.38022 type:complete len:200 (+) Transcript_23113:107-706(+)|eukprot:CAMPEP_0184645186 /NCGR_PEP_ID=MMETSP0308-20130426/1708_1 /TAXON_ID=38269 /ORGANISM="Gloeochaete witrockiana, Strain SAG 46.84" /LENGTH=199 /DNA_ID=CAMNT_0027074037 /DNA_START=103 /DNA_END=702 /DNA_ORIENTATION=+
MKILAIATLRVLEGKDPTILASAYDLNGFGYFQRSGAKEMMVFLMRTFASRTQPGQRQSIQHNEYLGHVYRRPDGLAGIVISDIEYTPRVAFSLINKILDEFFSKYPSFLAAPATDDCLPFEPLEGYLLKYQNPAEADKLAKIQKDLDETKIVLHKTIESVLERGMKLEDLVEKSQDLSLQSKMFYKTAQKQNQCCIVM